MLIEAKEQVEHGEWGPWLDRHFHLSRRQARAYMQLAELQKGGGHHFATTLDDVISPDRPSRVNAPAYHEPVQRVIKRVGRVSTHAGAPVQARNSYALPRNPDSNGTATRYRVTEPGMAQLRATALCAADNDLRGQSRGHAQRTAGTP